MSLASCEKCWDDLCACGWQYRNWNKKSRIELAANCLGISEKILNDLVGPVIPDDHPKKEE